MCGFHGEVGCRHHRQVLENFFEPISEQFRVCEKSGRKRRARSGSRLGLNFPQCGQFGDFESGVVEAHFQPRAGSVFLQTRMVTAFSAGS